MRHATSLGWVQRPQSSPQESSCLLDCGKSWLGLAQNRTYVLKSTTNDPIVRPVLRSIVGFTATYILFESISDFAQLSPQFLCRMEQEFYRRHSMSEAKDENSSAKTSSAAARRSFFRRKHKHKRSGSKDGKELLALDTISTDSIPFLDGKCLNWICLAHNKII